MKRMFVSFNFSRNKKETFEGKNLLGLFSISTVLHWKVKYVYLFRKLGNINGNVNFGQKGARIKNWTGWNDMIQTKHTPWLGIFLTKIIWITDSLFLQKISTNQHCIHGIYSAGFIRVRI